MSQVSKSPVSDIMVRVIKLSTVVRFMVGDAAFIVHVLCTYF